VTVRKAVFPAAGLGTRFLPATKAQPKEMLPLVDKPTIQYVVEEAVASGLGEIIIVTGLGKRAIEADTGNPPCRPAAPVSPRPGSAWYSTGREGGCSEDLASAARRSSDGAPNVAEGHK
jgi:NDP-sugar pyrophosphorylase family protein